METLAICSTIREKKLARAFVLNALETTHF